MTRKKEENLSKSKPSVGYDFFVLHPVHLGFLTMTHFWLLDSRKSTTALLADTTSPAKWDQYLRARQNSGAWRDNPSSNITVLPVASV